MQLKVFNKENQTTTITPYNVAEQLITIYGATATGSNAETVLQALAHSYLDIRQDSDFDIIEALNYLNYKLEAVRKTISFWDAYQIRGAVTQDNIQAQLTQLPNNSSIINNTEYSFIWYDSNNIPQQVYPGDVFVKDYQNIVHLIPATNKGIYKPEPSSATASGSQLVLPYKYVESITAGDHDVTITWSGVSFGDNSGYNYHNTITNGGSFSFGKLTYQGNDIIPIVKIFTFQTPHELILNGYSISISGSQYVITNETEMPIYFEVR